MPSVKPAETKAILRTALVPPASLAIAKATGSIPALAAPVSTRKNIAISNVAARPVSREAAAKRIDTGMRILILPYRSDNTPKKNAQAALAKL